MDVNAAIAYAQRCLQQKLGPELTYHNVNHTFENVLPTAMELADQCRVSSEDKDLLAVAVAFHDIGWIIKGQHHERLGARLARQALPGFGFSPEQIERITSMILATRLPHQPTCLLERILVDADLGVLGQEDFWEHNDDLRAEMEKQGKPMSDEEWYRSQLAFLESHHFFTAAAKATAEPVKQQHMVELRRRLRNCEVGPNPSANGKSGTAALSNPSDQS